MGDDRKQVSASKQSTASKEPTFPAEKDAVGVVRPNMYVADARATSSTFDRTHFDHVVIRESTYANSLFATSNFTGSAFAMCNLDGAVIEKCSLKYVELRDCDTRGLIINGIRIGALLDLLSGRGN